ncbi:hypothetical protein F5878DRAFT_605147 [Lentinula raphanica]|uniref:Uncharacterized protein n=1 Tax=Lentinula raphanica TaxID=153919 RepID=A0AA38UJM8_9AGAR|nr:hypothetical protein F5878DRAFT_605147 [Lentinula raphanica]
MAFRPNHQINSSKIPFHMDCLFLCFLQIVFSSVAKFAIPSVIKSFVHYMKIPLCMNRLFVCSQVVFSSVGHCLYVAFVHLRRMFLCFVYFFVLNRIVSLCPHSSQVHLS